MIVLKYFGTAPLLNLVVLTRGAPLRRRREIPLGRSNPIRVINLPRERRTMALVRGGLVNSYVAAMRAWRRDRRGSSDAARRDVAIDLPISSEKDDAMSGWVSFVPFDLVVRDDDPFS